MAITEALRLVVDADTRGAVQGIENLGRTADRELTRSTQSLDKWGNRLTNIGAGMIGLGSVALVGLGAAAMASEEANLATVKLENTLKNMPKLAGESSQQFIDLAESIQDVTAADADAIVEAEALLGTFQLTATEIKGITPLVVDYARKFGIDIPDAAVQVGKALDGQVGALKRNGVSIDEAAFATDRYTAVQKALSEQVGGFAEAEGKTFAGSVQRLKNELGDLAEGIGKGAVNAFSSMFGVVDGLTSRLNSLSPAAQSTIGQFATYGSVALIASGGLSILVGQTLKMWEQVTKAAGGVGDLVTKLRNLSAAQLALGGLATGLVAVGVALDQYNKAEQRSNIKRLTDEFLAAGTSAAEMDAVLSSAAKHGVAELIGAFGELAQTNRAAAERFVERLEAAGASEEVLDRFRGVLETTAAAERQAAADTEGMSGALDEQAGNTEEAASALEEYSNELKAMTDPLFAAMDAITGNRDAQLAYSDALAGVTTAQAALDEAIANHGATSAEASEATRGLEDAQRTLNDAQWRTVESAAEVDSALAALQDAVANGDVQVDEFRSTLQAWVAQGFLTQAQADAAAASVGGLATQAAVANTMRVSLPVNAPGASQAAAEVANLKARLDDLPSSRTVTINQVWNTIGQAFGFGGGRAHGGPVSGGRLYEVAEGNKAELLEMAGRTYLIPGSDGTVVPAGDWAGGSGMGAGGGYVDNRTTVYEIHGSDPQSVVEAIQRYERRNGAGWRN